MELMDGHKIGELGFKLHRLTLYLRCLEQGDLRSANVIIDGVHGPMSIPIDCDLKDRLMLYIKDQITTTMMRIKMETNQ